jgi:hypothetical protein
LIQRFERQGRPSLGIFDSNLSVSGTRTGAIVSIGLVILAWLAIPVARPFILGTVGLGIITGLLLLWRHRRGYGSS